MRSTGRNIGDLFALSVATCGVGYLPLAPGTWGSVVGVGIYLLISRNAGGTTIAGTVGPQSAGLQQPILLVSIVVLTIAGTWAATRAEALLGHSDPRVVVIDEVVGQMLAFVFLPSGAKTWALLLGFLLFRAFDIWKPYPIRRLEALESGLGVMADDILAGLYAAVTLSLIASLSYATSGR